MGTFSKRKISRCNLIMKYLFKHTKRKPIPTRIEGYVSTCYAHAVWMWHGAKMFLSVHVSVLWSLNIGIFSGTSFMWTTWRHGQFIRLHIGIYSTTSFIWTIWEILGQFIRLHIGIYSTTSFIWTIWEILGQFIRLHIGIYSTTSFIWTIWEILGQLIRLHIDFIFIYSRTSFIWTMWET